MFCKDRINKRKRPKQWKSSRKINKSKIIETLFSTTNLLLSKSSKWMAKDGSFRSSRRTPAQCQTMMYILKTHQFRQVLWTTAASNILYAWAPSSCVSRIFFSTLESSIASNSISKLKSFCSSNSVSRSKSVSFIKCHFSPWTFWLLAVLAIVTVD